MVAVEVTEVVAVPVAEDVAVDVAEVVAVVSGARKKSKLGKMAPLLTLSAVVPTATTMLAVAENVSSGSAPSPCLM